MVLLGDEAARKICERLPPGALAYPRAGDRRTGQHSPRKRPRKFCRNTSRLTTTEDSVARGGPDFATQLLVKDARQRGEPSAGGSSALTGSYEQELRSDPESRSAADRESAGAGTSSNDRSGAGSPERGGVEKRAVAAAGTHANAGGQAARGNAEFLARSGAKDLRRAAAEAGRARGTGPAFLRGVDTVADLLNRVGPKVTTDLLAGIEKENANLAATIRNQMFTFEDFVEVPETGLRELLAQVDKKMLATGLKGASENLRNHFFKCMSSRAVEMLKEDMEALGPIKSKDVNQAQSEIVAVARKLEAEGKMTLKNETEDAYVV